MASMVARDSFSSLVARSGLTYTELADKAGVSRAVITRLVRGDDNLREVTLWKIARAYALETSMGEEDAFNTLFERRADEGVHVDGGALTAMLA